MILLVQTKQGLTEVEALSLFKSHDRTFFTHLSINSDEFCVADLKVGYRIAYGDTEKEAIDAAFLMLEKHEVLTENYVIAESRTGIIKMNLQAVAREQLEEKDGFLVCCCAMECLEDSSICRHRNRNKED